MFALALISLASAGTIVQWNGVNGAEHLPCTSGGHWILSPAQGITSATLTVNGEVIPMDQNGQGSFEADSTGPLIAGQITASADYEGTNSSTFLKLSHCTGESSTPTPTPTNTATPTNTPTNTVTPTPTDTPTSTPTVTATPTGTTTSTATPTGTSTGTPTVTVTSTATPSTTATPTSPPSATATPTTPGSTPSATATQPTQPTATPTVPGSTPSATSTPTQPGKPPSTATQPAASATPKPPSTGNGTIESQSSDFLIVGIAIGTLLMLSASGFIVATRRRP